MKPYLDCISQGVCTIMASYNSWNGDRVHGHRFLLTEILKDKIGFKVGNHMICIVCCWQGRLNTEDLPILNNI